ncbi:MAG: ABC transporter substrate-binding protein [Thermomicrobiales bacterium]|nr:ABC transporter substrate-binding protein [Thermomicrobiales bacterium]
MDDPQDDNPQPPVSRGERPDADLTRRALFGTVFGGVAVVAGLQTLGDRFAAQDAASQQGRAASQTKINASPVASPVASPAASPIATPAGPEMIGALRVERGSSFNHTGWATQGDTLSLFIASDGQEINLSPPSFRHDYLISASYLDPLLWIDDRTMEPRPWLAESWSWDDSGKVVTLKLRDGVTWHDGTPLRARDVTFSYNIYRDDIDSNVRNIFNQMEAIRAIDDLTVEVTLLTPDANWLLNAATQLVFQRAQYRDHWASRDAGERTLADFDWGGVLPIGTGPWKVTNTSPDGVTFARNDAYFATPPHSRTLELLATTSDEERFARWNDGDGDILGNIRVTDLPQLQETPGVLYVVPGANVMFAAFNFENRSRAFPGLLGDVRIRQALSLAVDRSRYATDLFANTIRPMQAGTIAQAWANDSSVLSPERDAAKATSLLAEAGLTDLNNDGFLEDFNGEPLVLSAIVQENAQPALIQVLQGLSADFREVGIHFEVRVLDAEAFATSWMDSRDYDLIAYAYPLYPGFTDFDLYGSNFDIRANPQGWNPGGYSNEQVDDLIRRQLVTVDLDRQREILAELQEVVNTDLFGLWFGFPDELVIAREEILGFRPNAYLSTWNTRLLWRSSGTLSGATPVAATSPLPSPVP